MTDFALWNGPGPEILTTSSVSGGLALTKSASDNTKSAYTELVASTSRYYSGFWVQFCQNNTGSNPITTSLVDIAFSTNIVVPDLLAFGQHDAYFMAYDPVFFPIAIPAGTQLQARLQQLLVGTGTPAIKVWGVPGNPQLVAPYGRVTSYGANTADSGGVTVDCGGTANTKVRAQIAASTTNPMRHMIVCIGDAGSNRTTATRFVFDIEVGTGASRTPIVRDVALRGGALQKDLRPSYFQFPVNIPAGAELSINASASQTGAANRVFDVVLMGIG